MITLLLTIWRRSVIRSVGPQQEMFLGEIELVQGTLELLALKTLSLEPMHSWGIAQRIEQFSRGTFSVNQGSLYPALQRMKRKGWIRSAWRVTENNRRARYYELTPLGLSKLEEERSDWQISASAVNWVLNARLS